MKFSLKAFALAPLAVPLDAVMWRASGADSGPPDDSFIEHLLRDLSDPLMLFFPCAGLITTVLYWRIGRGRPDPRPSP